MYQIDCRFNVRLNYSNFLKEIEYLSFNHKNIINNCRLNIDKKLDF